MVLFEAYPVGSFLGYHVMIVKKSRANALSCFSDWKNVSHHSTISIILQLLCNNGPQVDSGARLEHGDKFSKNETFK